MKLMTVTLMTPLRDEKAIIYKWEERSILLNPRNVESVGFVDEIKHVQLLLTSGRCVVVKESLKDISYAYERCTSE